MLKWSFLWTFLFFIELQLVYNVLVSGVQQVDADIYRVMLFSIMIYYRRLNISPCVIQ